MIRTSLLALSLVSAIGCTTFDGGAASFTNVDLVGDLDAETLARYQEEVAAARADGASGDELVIEKTDLWPLGLLAYWERGTVTAHDMPGHGTLYSVEKTRGYGPLAMVWVSEERATFDAKGVRMDGSLAGSVLWGHLAMVHEMDHSMCGMNQKHTSLHLLHHLINVSTVGDKTAVYLLSGPNPVGFGG